MRMDGYWLVSDLLGIPNLNQTASNYVLTLAGRIKTYKGPPITSYQRLIVLYALGNYVIFGYFMVTTLFGLFYYFFGGLFPDTHQYHFGRNVHQPRVL